VEKVTLGFGSEATSLNKVCDVAFNQQRTNWSVKLNYEDNVWVYCSIVGAKYTFVFNEYDNKFGSKPEHKNKILSVKSGDNEAFWEERNEQFFGEAGKDGLGVKASEDSEFAKLYEKKNSRGVDDTIKKKCEVAYSFAISETSGTPKVKDEDIKRFCYLIPE
ncbi:hypothetical protein, partial [Candidatus Mycoplasma haematohominis]|uniref:hypothetical protein n=1 Tax=Candidatus Mycoplasma haematohominis TaxID=1494318 RepID=UPI001C0A6A39